MNVKISEINETLLERQIKSQFSFHILYILQVHTRTHIYLFIIPHIYTYK